MIGKIPHTALKSEAEDPRRIQPMHGRPVILAIADICRNALLANNFGKLGNEAVTLS